MDPFEANVSYGQVHRPPGRISINSNYLLSIPGFLRVLLILATVGGGIAALLIGSFSQTVQAYLVVIFIGAFISALIFALHVFNIVHVKIFNKLPWIMIVNDCF